MFAKCFELGTQADALQKERRCLRLRLLKLNTTMRAKGASWKVTRGPDVQLW